MRIHYIDILCTVYITYLRVNTRIFGECERFFGKVSSKRYVYLYNMPVGAVTSEYYANNIPSSRALCSAVMSVLLSSAGILQSSR